MLFRKLFQILVSGAPTDTKTRVDVPPTTERPDDAFDPDLVRRRDQAQDRLLRSVD